MLNGRTSPDPVRRLVIGRLFESGESRPAWIGVLNEEGLRDLRRSGHDAIAGACAPDIPAARVRFMDISHHLTLESASAAELAALFASPFPDRPLITESRSGGPNDVVVGLRVPPDLRCLQGHFPGLPVVPGAAQLGWALEFGADLLGTAPSFRSLRSVKFERIIQPGQLLRLSLEANRDSSKLRFEYASAAGKHSSGHIDIGRGDA